MMPVVAILAGVMFIGFAFVIAPMTPDLANRFGADAVEVVNPEALPSLQLVGGIIGGLLIIVGVSMLIVLLVLRIKNKEQPVYIKKSIPPRFGLENKEKE